ncbi:MAG: NmrA family NAD(P)-binding protein [Ornithinimicrobium sp.]
MTTTVVVAGGTGDLGHRIVRELLTHDTYVRVLTRPGSGAAQDLFGDTDRVDVVEASYSDPAALAAATSGAHTVVSAVSGIRPVIVDAQHALLTAALSAGVQRFIPSDFSADYRQIARGSNRNFELRREFAAELDAAPLRATSVLNGMFTDLLTGVAPMILFTQGRVLFWSDPDQILDFTTKDDTARFTARVALDDDAPRVMEIAGDRVTARDIAATMTELTGDRFKLQWAGTTSTLGAMATIGRLADRKAEDTFPAWQGMQYFVSMFSGQAQLHHVDNDRYGAQSWATVREVLETHVRRDG